MLFNSYIFIFLFFPLTLIGYFGLNYARKYKAALAFLVGMSLWFYGYNSIYYLAILVISIVLNYFLVKRMQCTATKARRRFYLFAGLFLNVGILFYFKYYDFFIWNINAILKTELSFLRLALPLGISFYTFQQLSYVFDAYKNECETYSFLEYAAYVSYFPQLVAGPIVYHSELIPQFRDLSKKKLDFDFMSKGLYAFALGLSKKVLLADTFSKIVTIGYANISELNTPSVILVMVCYSLQIYFDFSGYCDMAYGMAYMMNIQLPQNFNSPYKAASITEFWDRWHMTLTRFFTQYVYIPLGGSRTGLFKTCRNVLIVFLISGFWHGANWTFILWGALHGICRVTERLLHIPEWKLPRFVKVGVTFVLVTLGWSLFRAESLSDAFLLWSQLIHGGFGPIYAPITDKFNELIEMKAICRAGLGTLTDRFPFLFPSLFAICSYLACLFTKNTQEKTGCLQLTNRKLITVVILMIWSILSLAEISEFLYFNF